jgi:hypothetical protein
MSQVREILSINVGQAGCQLGNTVWKQYNAEHGVVPEEAWKPKDHVTDDGDEDQVLVKAKTFYDVSGSD